MNKSVSKQLLICKVILTWADSSTNLIIALHQIIENNGLVLMWALILLMWLQNLSRHLFFKIFSSSRLNHSLYTFTSWSTLKISLFHSLSFCILHYVISDWRWKCHGNVHCSIISQSECDLTGPNLMCKYNTNTPLIISDKFIWLELNEVYLFTWVVCVGVFFVGS